MIPNRVICNSLFALCDYVENIVTNDKNNKYYLFNDEVQITNEVKDEESDIVVTIYDMLNELKGYSNLDCYVISSNSKILSSDIATEFRGRLAKKKYIHYLLKKFILLYKLISEIYWMNICNMVEC